MNSTRVTLLGIIGALGAVLGLMETVLPIPMGLILIYVFQENRKEVMFSVLVGKLVLLLQAIVVCNVFYVSIFFITSIDELAGVIVFSRATCINSKTLIATGTASAMLQNAFTVVCLYLTRDVIFVGTPIDIQWFTSGVLIPLIILGALLYGFCFISVFGAVRDILDDIRAVIVPYTSRIQELNNLTNYVQREVELVGEKEQS